MIQKSILKKLENNEITAEEALKTLYPVKHEKPGRRASIVKMSFKVPEEGKALNTFFKILFAIPIPIIFARLGLRLAGRLANRFTKIQNFDFKEISKLLKYSKDTRILVESDEILIDIKVM